MLIKRFICPICGDEFVHKIKTYDTLHYQERIIDSLCRLHRRAGAKALLAAIITPKQDMRK